MTKQDRELLLIDLSGRLPYHPIIYGKRNYTFNEGPLGSVNTSGIRFMTGGGTVCDYYLEEVKPYLRPLSDMTEEEIKGLEKYTYEAYTYKKGDVEIRSKNYLVANFGSFNPDNQIRRYSMSSSSICVRLFHWLHKHHFDYRGLIEKGLALRAPKGMYKMN